MRQIVKNMPYLAMLKILLKFLHPDADDFYNFISPFMSTS